MLKLAFLNEFQEILNNCSNVVCIGTGAHLKKICPAFPALYEKITALADNSPEKQQQEYLLSENKKIKIRSVEESVRFVGKDTVVLIASKDYAAILEQLSVFDWFGSTDIYCTKHLFALLEEKKLLMKKIPENLKIYSEQRIPKVIHYCWFGKNPVPDKYREWMKSWKKFCPDYEIVEWNESNYDITKNKYMYQAYQEKKWGFVPDYARLDIIYDHGGIYLDTDVELIKNIDHLLYQNAFVGFESDEYVALGLGFGAVKGHPLIKEMMGQYNELEFIDRNGDLNLKPSPAYQTDVLLKHGLVQNGEYQIIDDMTVFPAKMLSGKSFILKVVNPADYTCSVHHYDASWLNDDKKKAFTRFENEMKTLFDRNSLGDSNDKSISSNSCL